MPDKKIPHTTASYRNELAKVHYFLIMGYEL